MISSFRIKNFKSYRDATLPLAPLTLLIGANASGKSNAIEAIRLLSMIGSGDRVDGIVSQIQSSDDLVRGNAWDFPRDRELPLTLGCDLDHGEWSHLEVSLRLAEDDPKFGVVARVGDEAICRRDGQYLYRASSSPDVLGERVTRFYTDSSTGPLHAAAADRAALFASLDMLVSPGLGGRLAQVRDVGAQFRESLMKVRFFDPQPRRMRGYSYHGERALKEDGENVSAVLLGVHFQLGSGPILDFVSILPEQPFVEVGFIETPRGDVMVRLTESYGGREEIRDAPVLSDGTLRVLGIAAALLSAEPGSTIIIEEIDNGVHPSRAEMLLRKIERVAKERDLRVLLTTHNPALLDRLPTDSIPHVVCAYRDPEEGDSRLVRLEDLPNYPELVARGPLGQLMTRGVLDYFLKHQETEEARKARNLRWLETLDARVRDL
ncbi:AAA family ATPase [Longimicrobium sp.]|uniref:AAA family ATPase n=1 Tax=Longimicrobium sp. TaxID=2029185 RepID=UPI002E36F175|nr:AAA family ATPase [Longimicrobium sp.]HEX6042768.1 AAA family ATPase [Longimicrobium sp.]